MADFQREEDEDDGQDIEGYQKLVDGLTEAFSEARIAVERAKETVETKKKNPEQFEDADDTMTDGIEPDDITNAINKFITLKGDMRLSEAKEFIEENPDMVEKFL